MSSYQQEVMEYRGGKRCVAPETVFPPHSHKGIVNDINYLGRDEFLSAIYITFVFKFDLISLLYQGIIDK